VPADPNAESTIEELTSAAEAGNTDAMYDLASAFSVAGDSLMSEMWLLRAADGGDADAMYSMGITEFERGNLELAESWYKKASARGVRSAAYNLGMMMRRRGDDEAAVAQLLRAANRGHIRAAAQLGLLLQKLGDDAQAERWLVAVAAQREDATALSTAGAARAAQGNLTEAESLFLRAVAGGEPRALTGLGGLRMRVGNYEEAEQWFSRAAEAGVLGSAETARELRTILATLPALDSVVFDTSGWALHTFEPNLRVWQDNSWWLVELFDEAAPENGIFSPGDGSPGSTDSYLEDIVTSFGADKDGWRGFIAREFPTIRDPQLPDKSKCISERRFEVDGASCVEVVVQAVSDGQASCILGVLVPFATCSWVLVLGIGGAPNPVEGYNDSLIGLVHQRGKDLIESMHLGDYGRALPRYQVPTD
jgi:TPR repeat protein